MTVIEEKVKLKDTKKQLWIIAAVAALVVAAVWGSTLIGKGPAHMADESDYNSLTVGQKSWIDDSSKDDQYFMSSDYTDYQRKMVFLYVVKDVCQNVGKNADPDTMAEYAVNADSVDLILPNGGNYLQPHRDGLGNPDPYWTGHRADFGKTVYDNQVCRTLG